jgi:hypothetical protein
MVGTPPGAFASGGFAHPAERQLLLEFWPYPFNFWNRMPTFASGRCSLAQDGRRRLRNVNAAAETQ